MDKVQTEDVNYIRDINSHALLAHDKVALMKHRNERKRLSQQSLVINKMQDEINTIQDDILEIKNLLIKIAQGVNINGI